MKRSIAALGLLVGAVAIPPTPATASVPQADDCTVAPALAATVEHATESRPRTPYFVGDHVWFGGSIYRPDATLVGPAPNGTPRGEVPEFMDDILNVRTVTWGVVVDMFPGADVYSTTGELLVDLPIEVHAEAIYAGGHILVADWGEVSSHLERVLLVKQDGTVLELTNQANGFNQFGTIANDIVYVQLKDGGIATFDLAGQSGPILEPSVLFNGITSANGYVYAYEGPVFGRGAVGTTIHLFTEQGSKVTEVSLDGSAVRLGPTALGFAVDVASDDGNHAFAMAPNGAGLIELAGLHEGIDRSSLAWHTGRYLVGLEALSEDSDLVITTRIRLYSLDGVPINASAAFELRPWPASLPGGTVLALVGPEGRTVDFRSLSGSLLSHVDYGLVPPHNIEVIDGNDEYIWVTTQREDLLTAYVYDLGECGGSPDPGTFLDDDHLIFEADIEWLAAQAITRGCNPHQANTRFCPTDNLTRGEMAALLHRALGEAVDADGPPISFTDTSASIFAADIEWLSAAGITQGCSLSTFCPRDPVTRGQMAAFLVRALDLPLVTAPERFVDDDTSVFEDDIAALAAAGITTGCADDRFCPNDPVSRAEVAAFLHRALDERLAESPTTKSDVGDV